jgi:UDP-N-acetylmuramyl pentapeptide phosphotransferase/UDP-N-acetylglucosamine-1-phosphate transferase
VIARIAAFGRFWYRFFVGDDWTIALGVVVALAATYGLSRTSFPAWFIAPAAVVLLLATSVARASKPPHGEEQ